MSEHGTFLWNELLTEDQPTAGEFCRSSSAGNAARSMPAHWGPTPCSSATAATSQG